MAGQFNLGPPANDFPQFSRWVSLRRCQRLWYEPLYFSRPWEQSGFRG
jgi:hypothetical protein